MNGGRSRSLILGSFCALLWLAALFVAVFLALMGFVGTGFGLILGALPFLLSLPVALLGFWSHRASAIGLVILFVSDLVLSAWPHVSVTSYFDSKIGITFFTLTTLNLFIWATSSFPSVIDFVKRCREDY